jgi:hypothetical protein
VNLPKPNLAVQIHLPPSSVGGLSFLNPARFDTEMHSPARMTAMLAEQFFLVLETLRSHASDDKPPIVTSTTRHIPITLPLRK